MQNTSINNPITIDDWQARFEAGLPVYATDSIGTYLCVGVGPQGWKQAYSGVTFSMTNPSLVQQAPISNLCNEITLGAATECSLPQPTIKEQPMNHTIQLTAEQFEALQSGQSITIEPPKPTVTKWEPVGGHYCISNYYLIASYWGGAPKEAVISGLSYKTQSQADSAAKALRSYARQLAWLTENDDGWKADWSNEDQTKYFVEYSHSSKKFQISFCRIVNLLGVIYMSQDNAIKLAQLMNDGIVEF